MTKFTFVCALLTLACNAPDSSDADVRKIAVDLSDNPTNPTFSWSGGAMHEFEVYGCENCKCDRGDPAAGMYTSEWRLSIDIFQEPLPEPHVFSPVQYGIVDGQMDPTANPLDSGASYLVWMASYVPCDYDPHECRHVVALGCATFVAP
jgi:hypothetical protein